MPASFQQRLRRLALLGGLAAVAFAMPLVHWVRYCVADDLFSYALLVPFITGWLIWQQARELKFEFQPAPAVAGVLGAGACLLAVASLFVGGNGEAGQVNRLTLQILALVAGLNALAVAQLGGVFMRQLVFPAAFLVFAAPIPTSGVQAIEVGLQHASATASGWLFSLTGASYLQQGLVFQLPNITLEVAPECSGIRSTLVLFITSLIAGYLFLRRPWQRAAFTALVIPLGIARNAARIVTIGWLCIERGPEMIDSAIHRRGGPVFFALSLVPLFLLLFGFRWWDGRSARVVSRPAAVAAEPPTEPLAGVPK